ncbi:MAG: LysM peptidoglycan-binding domain-containing protein [Bacteroidota bacterium]
MRKFVVLFLLLVPALAFCTGDSLRYLTPKDTIFLQLDLFQEKIFEHRLEKGQTLYSLARFYGLSMEELYYFNPEVQEQNIPIGQVLRIPIPNRSIIRYKGAEFEENKHIPICYIVKPGDSLYGISKRIFKMPIDSMANRNNMPSYELSIGQVLQIGWMNIDGIPSKYRKNRLSPQWRKSVQLRGTYTQQAGGKREFQEQGVAYWQKDGKQKTDLYALHRKAPLNSVIAISNPMKKRTVYAKVIGRIPESVYGDEVKVVISSRTAKLLGARDARFFVKLKYLR